jgi:hypothetical protein
MQGLGVVRPAATAGAGMRGALACRCLGCAVLHEGAEGGHPGAGPNHQQRHVGGGRQAQRPPLRPHRHPNLALWGRGRKRRRWCVGKRTEHVTCGGGGGDRFVRMQVHGSMRQRPPPPHLPRVQARQPGGAHAAAAPPEGRGPVHHRHRQLRAVGMGRQAGRNAEMAGLQAGACLHAGCGAVRRCVCRDRLPTCLHANLPRHCQQTALPSPREGLPTCRSHSRGGCAEPKSDSTSSTVRPGGGGAGRAH